MNNALIRSRRESARASAAPPGGLARGAPRRRGRQPNPRIEIWHGPRQRFGHLGLPQGWINVLGSVSPAATIAEISYTVNGG
ncbi:MAG: hypothetical protein R2729_11400 [Bryobacteraceae bacterium]